MSIEWRGVIVSAIIVASGMAVISVLSGQDRTADVDAANLMRLNQALHTSFTRLDEAVAESNRRHAASAPSIPARFVIESWDKAGQYTSAYVLRDKATNTCVLVIRDVVDQRVALTSQAIPCLGPER